MNAERKTKLHTNYFAMLSIQNPDGRPLVSVGIELDTYYESDERGGRWVAEDKNGRRATGAHAIDVVCRWLSEYAPVR